MREAVFLKRNKKKWEEMEILLKKYKEVKPSILSDLYIDLMEDLSYAKTQYPTSNTTIYLNGLAVELYQAIYENKKEKGTRIFHFWQYELPFEFFKVQRYLLYSFLIFAFSVLIGVVSTAYDESFPRVILGDDYVNMTLANINNGDPMAVYKSPDKTSMFYRITTNNIRVSFLTFVSGIMGGIGTVYMLFKNGVMLGAFQWFFYGKGLLQESFLVIWIHGTLEISAIVIAGAAGLLVGAGVLFPKTYKRSQSIVMKARQGLKIIVGLVPIFIMAGFLESFVTRLTDMHWTISLFIIFISALFILYYFVLYPLLLHQRWENDEEFRELLKSKGVELK
ncbi:MAG: stage II sporulation protein M [Cytophagales bacterium]|nr:stage II sporulation protein M [Cytophagales bacterium]